MHGCRVSSSLQPTVMRPFPAQKEQVTEAARLAHAAGKHVSPGRHRAHTNTQATRHGLAPTQALGSTRTTAATLMASRRYGASQRIPTRDSNCAIRFQGRGPEAGRHMAMVMRRFQSSEFTSSRQHLMRPPAVRLSKAQLEVDAGSCWQPKTSSEVKTAMSP